MGGGGQPCSGHPTPLNSVLCLTLPHRVNLDSWGPPARQALWGHRDLLASRDLMGCVACLALW